jgi:STE24 endopeptidase
MIGAMSAFEPNAATDAYLAILSPEAHAKATAYTQGGHWLLLWGWLVALASCLIIARTGVLRRAVGWIERRRPHPVLGSFVAALLFLGIDEILELPWNVYAAWWREAQYGLTSQSIGGWLGDKALGDAIGIVIGAIFIMVAYAVIRRLPRSWFLWAAAIGGVGMLFLTVIQPVVIEPLFNTYTPAPDGAIKRAVVALAQKAGVPSDKIFVFNGSKQSNRYTANVAGLFGSARIAMSDVMFQKGADIPQVRGVVGHEMGHYVHQHALLFSGLITLLLGVSLWLAERLFPWANRRIGAGARSIADPVGLPAAIAIFATLSLLGTPILSTVTRAAEADADAFSLRIAHEPDGLARGLVQTIEYRADSPSALEEFLFYDHPSVRRRVHRAMVWKAEHLAETEAQEAADKAAEP